MIRTKARPRQASHLDLRQISFRQYKGTVIGSLCTNQALMAAQTALLSAGLQRAGTQRSVPAINGSIRPNSGVQGATRALPTQLSQKSAALSHNVGIKRHRSVSSPVIAASTYENGYGTVGTPDDQLDRPAAEPASVLASDSPRATQRTVQVPPPVTAPGAGTV